MGKELKFEDFIIGEWYWDNFDKKYFQVIDLRTIEKKVPENLFEPEHIETTNEIFRIYDKNIKYAQSMTYKDGENRFYKYKEDVEYEDASVLSCPCCKESITNVWSRADYKPQYCHFCGQKLSWS